MEYMVKIERERVDPRFPRSDRVNQSRDFSFIIPTVIHRFSYYYRTMPRLSILDYAHRATVWSCVGLTVS